MKITLENLLDYKSISAEEVQLLKTAIKEKQSIIIFGAMGSGVTTMKHVLLSEMAQYYTIGTIEEPRELLPTQNEESDILCFSVPTSHIKPFEDTFVIRTLADYYMINTEDPLFTLGTLANKSLDTSYIAQVKLTFPTSKQVIEGNLLGDEWLNNLQGNTVLVFAERKEDGMRTFSVKPF